MMRPRTGDRTMANKDVKTGKDSKPAGGKSGASGTKKK